MANQSFAFALGSHGQNVDPVHSASVPEFGDPDFSVFRCQMVSSIEGIMVLQQDFNVACHGKVHSRAIALAAVFMGIYIVGVPSLFL